jgi:hypothetical protein
MGEGKAKLTLIDQPAVSTKPNPRRRPPSYLLRLDTGKDMPCDYGQISLTAEPQAAAPKPQGPMQGLAGAAAAAAAVAAAVRAGAPSPPPPGAAAAPPPPPAVPTPVAGYQPTLQQMQEAQKAAKYAVSSLSFDDVAGSVKYLTEALRLLTQPGAGSKS